MRICVVPGILSTLTCHTIRLKRRQLSKLIDLRLDDKTVCNNSPRHDFIKIVEMCMITGIY